MIDQNDLHSLANSFISSLSPEVDIYWQAKIKEMYAEDPLTASGTISTIKSYIARNKPCDAYCPPGIIIGSSSKLTEKYLSHLLPSETAQLFSLLKDRNILMQIGGGKGKAFMVYSNRRLAFSHAIYSQSKVDPNDKTALTQALINSIEYDALDIKALKNKIKEQQETIERHQFTIQQLSSQQAKAHNQTWA